MMIYQYKRCVYTHTHTHKHIHIKNTWSKKWSIRIIWINPHKVTHVKLDHPNLDFGEEIVAECHVHLELSLLSCVCVCVCKGHLVTRLERKGHLRKKITPEADDYEFWSSILGKKRAKTKESIQTRTPVMVKEGKEEGWLVCVCVSHVG